MYQETDRRQGYYTSDEQVSNYRSQSAEPISQLHYEQKCSARKLSPLVHHTEQELVADMSAGNVRYVQEG